MVEVFVATLANIAKYIIPTMLVGIPFYALAVKKVPVYEVFVDLDPEDDQRVAALELLIVHGVVGLRRRRTHQHVVGADGR